jgi:Zn-finger nucleic acid-binding protein
MELKTISTMRGIEIDFCTHCKGVWLDKDKIFELCSNPETLKKFNFFEVASANAIQSQRISPKTGKNMLELSLFRGRLKIDFCKESGGLWFDRGELKRFFDLAPTQLSEEEDMMLSFLRGVEHPDYAMVCPCCKDVNLETMLTRQGVEVDYCPVCRGVWLDKYKFSFFTKNSTGLIYELFKSCNRSSNV